MLLNLSHYAFFEIPRPQEARDRLDADLVGSDVVGTVLIASEGVNFNLAGTPELLREKVTAWLRSLSCPDLKMKESFSEFPPFKRLKIKVKPEIVTLGIRDLDVPRLRAPHISPQDFRKILETQPQDVLILDTRNDFEFELGSFRGAQPVKMKSFRNFPEAAKNFPRDKTLVMFCTGGIRCEKASAYLRREGFEKVLQLDGGILRYFENCGDDGFEGQCFVFDERVSVDGSLKTLEGDESEDHC